MVSRPAATSRWSHVLQDEWLECQRNWLYLESIFGAPDIQRQLPNEAKMFIQVDKSWKEIMRRVQKFPNCIQAGTKPGVCVRVFIAMLYYMYKCVSVYIIGGV